VLRPGEELALERFLVGQAAAFCSFSLPFLRAAHSAGSADPPDGVAAAALSATLAAHLAASGAARRASEAAGAAMLRSAAAAFPDAVAACASLRACAGGSRLHGAIVFGFVCGALRLTLPSAARASLYMALRDMAQASVRLNLIGPLAATAVTARLAACAEALLVIALAAAAPPSEAAAAAPLADCLQAGHDALFSRLFQS
jgi:urease accessory protein UreF